MSEKDSIPTSKQRRWPRKLTIALVCIGVVASLVIWANQWEFRRALPWSAKNIHERYFADSLLPDYDYRLKAEITEEQFNDYIRKFELTPHTPDRRYGEAPGAYLDWGQKSDWWDPDRSLDKTYVWQGSDTWILAKYERGNLYLYSICH